MTTSDGDRLREELLRTRPEEGGRLLAGVDPAEAAAVLRSLDSTHQAELLAWAGPVLRAELLVRMPPDERARLLGEVEVPEQWLEALPADERRATQRLLHHPPESVGRLMTPRVLELSPDELREAALERIRSCAPEIDTVYVLPVTSAGSFVGMVELRAILAAPDRTPVGHLVREAPRVLSPEDDQEVAARAVLAAETLAVPVLGPDRALLGVVTVDDAMEVLQLEESEDVAMTSGVDPLRRPYLASSLLRLVRSRAVWLVVAASAGIITVRVLDHFEAELEQVVALALFIPLLLGTGGNIGAQAATTVVRAMAVDDLRLRDLPHVVGKEASVGLLLGGLLAGAAAVPISAVYEPRLALVVCLTLVSVCVIGTSAGSVLPLAVGRAGGDPAVVSAPFITTLVDATGLLVYFLYARLVFAM
jgi:magnesium transporter